MPTLTVLRRTLAPLLGTFERGTADAGALSTTTQLCCTTGLASGARFKSSVLSSSLYEGKWLYRPDAVDAGPAPAADDRDRLIDTYAPTSGIATIDDAWSAAPDDEVFEITSLFSGTDLNALVNAALKKVWVVREFTFTVSHANVRRHNLTTAAPWLGSWRWIYQIGHLQTGESRTGTATLQMTDPFTRPKTGTGEDLDGNVYIQGPELSWQTTDTVYVKAACPAYDFCRASWAGDYGDRSGLAAEAHEAAVDAEWVAWRAILEAKDVLDALEQSGRATQEAQRSRAMAHARAYALGKRYFQPPDRTFTPPRISIAPAVGSAWAVV
jgi:hypothetical protein